MFCSPARSYSNISCIESEQNSLLDIKKGLVDKSDRLASQTGEDFVHGKELTAEILGM